MRLHWTPVRDKRANPGDSWVLHTEGIHSLCKWPETKKKKKGGQCGSSEVSKGGSIEDEVTEAHSIIYFLLCVFQQMLFFLLFYLLRITSGKKHIWSLLSRLHTKCNYMVVTRNSMASYLPPFKSLIPGSWNWVEPERTGENTMVSLYRPWKPLFFPFQQRGIAKF